MVSHPLSLAFALIAFGATLALLTLGTAASRCHGCAQEMRVERGPVHPVFAPSQQP
jgi:hypothetical protein